ncbi:MAG TPA: efflux RND transporter periplasmic adaptor subunit, partial [Arenibaculum sp.]|nr:efflux RND transporter periplasmic adaptor subunit [Arenibaculum sp.]
MIRSNLTGLLSAIAMVCFAGMPAAAQVGPATTPVIEDPFGVSLVRQIRAQLMPRRSILVASAMAGRVVELPWRDGDPVREGEVLVRFDCAVQQSQLARAKASLEKRRRIRDVNERLVKLGSVSKLELYVNEAEVQETTAEVRLMETMVDRCTLSAPFDGRIVDVQARQWQYSGEGQPLLEMVDDGELEVEMIVPSAWLAWTRPGHRFAIEVDETGKRYDAEITRLSGRVDAVSRSVKVYGKLLSPSPELMPGM